MCCGSISADENNGWAAGDKKKVLETHDGGQQLEAHGRGRRAARARKELQRLFLDRSSPPPTTASSSVGISRRDAVHPAFPDWMDPEEAMNRRETPHLSYSLVTRRWRQDLAAAFLLAVRQVISRVRFSARGAGLGADRVLRIRFRYPSEVYKIDWKTGTSTDRLIATGSSPSPISGSPRTARRIWQAPKWRASCAISCPGKVRFCKSSDLTNWTEMPVDYRADANAVILAGRRRARICGWPPITA